MCFLTQERQLATTTMPNHKTRTTAHGPWHETQEPTGTGVQGQQCPTRFSIRASQPKRFMALFVATQWPPTPREFTSGSSTASAMAVPLRREGRVEEGMKRERLLGLRFKVRVSVRG
jgi:hypothetical protein